MHINERYSMKKHHPNKEEWQKSIIFTIYTRARIFKGLKNSLISEHLRT